MRLSDDTGGFNGFPFSYVRKSELVGVMYEKNKSPQYFCPLFSILCVYMYERVKLAQII